MCTLGKHSARTVPQAQVGLCLLCLDLSHCAVNLSRFHQARLPGELQPVRHGISDAGHAVSVPQPPIVGTGGLKEEAPDMVRCSLEHSLRGASRRDGASEVVLVLPASRDSRYSCIWPRSAHTGPVCMSTMAMVAGYLWAAPVPCWMEMRLRWLCGSIKTRHTDTCHSPSHGQGSGSRSLRASFTAQ